MYFFWFMYWSKTGIMDCGLELIFLDRIFPALTSEE